MIPDKELVSRAKSVVRPRKSAAGKLVADVGAALVTEKGVFVKAKAIHIFVESDKNISLVFCCAG